jgi:hypothetical protein
VNANRDPRIKDPIPHHIVMLEKVRELAPKFDVLHFHVDVLHYPFLAVSSQTLMEAVCHMSSPFLRVNTQHFQCSPVHPTNRASCSEVHHDA